MKNNYIRRYKFKNWNVSSNVKCIDNDVFYNIVSNGIILIGGTVGLIMICFGIEAIINQLKKLEKKSSEINPF